MSRFSKYGELDEAVGTDPMMEHVFDLSALDKQDASKHLFGQVDWDEYLRAGVFLSQSEFQLLERAQDNIDFAMGNATSAKALANLLLKLADKCTSSVPAQQYVFTRVEEILQCGEGEFKTRAALFTVDGVNIHDGPFLRGLRASDSYIQKSASAGLATLLTAYAGEVNSLISWLCEMLQSDTQGATEIAIPALTVLMRRESCRRPFSAKGGIAIIVSVLTKLGRNGNAQHLYDLSFCLWTLSLDDASDISAFLSSGAITILTDLVLAAPSRKVVRMAVATLLNLTAGQDEGVLTEMLTGGLTKVLENMIHANAHKQAGDVEVEHDVRNLFEVLMRNYRDFSTYDRWVSEVKTGNLRWGIVHTEKFWRENAKLLEGNDFEMLKTLISLLLSESPTVVAVALYDLGEFTRFYPNGRGIVKSLGGKDSAMELIGHSDQGIQRHALQCISKIMVTNWEFMK
jgi:V-type H+-transporting ATPase subunit H